MNPYLKEIRAEPGNSVLSAHFGQSDSYSGTQKSKLCDQILQKRTRKLPARYFLSSL